MSDFIAHFHFLRPWWLLLVLPALAIWWLERREVDGTGRWRRAIDPELLAHLVVRGEDRWRLKPGDVMLAVWLIGAVAVAGPSWRQTPSPFASAARPAMIVLKVAPSMAAKDLAPSRLDRARQKLSDILDARAGAPTGLVAYGGSAHLVLPPTADGSVVLAMADALSPEIMPKEGDAMADAVALAAGVLGEARLGGSILLVADTVAPDQIGRIAPVTVPMTLFAMAPEGVLAADTGLAAAAKALGGTLVATTVDGSDVEAVTARLAAGAAPALPGVEAPGWEEAGYWLTPLVALVALLWFRRGWVLA